MMLRHLQFPSFADRLETAVKRVISEGKHRTKDLGGDSSTQEVVDAVIANLDWLITKLFIVYLGNMTSCSSLPSIPTWFLLYQCLNVSTAFIRNPDFFLWNVPMFKTLWAKQSMSSCLQDEFACKTTSLRSLNLEHLNSALHNKIWTHTFMHPPTHIPTYL